MPGWLWWHSENHLSSLNSVSHLLEEPGEARILGHRVDEKPSVWKGGGSCLMSDIFCCRY